MKFNFTLYHTDADSGARLGEFQTKSGRVETPVFMPVGTLATVNTLDAGELEAAGAQIILGNTYHLMLRPGVEVFERFGGIHKFMNWRKPVLTDSGGFQVFSLPNSRKVTEDGVVFQSYIDGSTIQLTPESCIRAQEFIGSDIAMVLDQCLESTADHTAVGLAMELTHRWAERSLKAHTIAEQALFGIVQGGVYPDLRKRSSDFITQLAFDGFAIGGLAVGETKSERENMTELVTQLLPKSQPRYLMGVGTPTDILEAVKRGIDMFDCIIPTKMAQQGNAYTSTGEVKLAQTAYKFSDERLDPNCSCTTCRQYSRGYLHHLTKCRETLGWRALAVHNIHFYQVLMAEIRSAIKEDRFLAYYRNCLNSWNHDEAPEVHREPAVITHPKKFPRGRLESSI